MNSKPTKVVKPAKVADKILISDTSDWTQVGKALDKILDDLPRRVIKSTSDRGAGK